MAILITVYSAGTIKRNRIWKNTLTLWSDAVKKYPRSITANKVLGAVYLKRMKYDKAIELSKRTLQLGGQREYVVHATLGSAYMGQEKWDLALPELKKATELYPYYTGCYVKLGVIYHTLGDFELAERQFKAAIRLDPQGYLPYFYLGGIYASQKRVEEAIQAYKEALSLSPADRLLKSRLLLGSILEGIGRKKEAGEYYLQVIQQADKGEGRLAQEARNGLERMGLLR